MIFPNVTGQPPASSFHSTSLHWRGWLFLRWYGFIRPNRGRSQPSRACFLSGYGVHVRSQFFREPEDGFMGVMTLGISMGQWLSLPMVVAGIIMIVWSYRTQAILPQTPARSDKPARPVTAGKRSRSFRKKSLMSLRHSYTIIAPLYDALASAGTGLRAASLAQLPQQPRQGSLNILISGIGTGLDLSSCRPCLYRPGCCRHAGTRQTSDRKSAFKSRSWRQRGSPVCWRFLRLCGVASHSGDRSRCAFLF